MSAHVFISHGGDGDSHGGDGEAAALAARIEALGATAWLAPRDLAGGEDPAAQARRAIAGCAAFVVLLREGADAPLRAEIEAARAAAKPIHAVRLAGAAPAAALVPLLDGARWTDAFGADRDTALSALADSLAATVAGGPGANDASPPAEPEPVAAAAAAAQPSFMAASPPAPPSPPTAASLPGKRPLPADTSLIEAAIGTNQAYYLAHWRRMDATGKSYNWNWAACILNVFWFAFRKMRGPAILLGIVWVVSGAMMADPANRTLFKAGALLLVLPSFVTGGFGNLWYRRRIERLVAGAATMDRARAIAHLRARGGTSPLGLVVAIVAVLLLSVLATLPAALEQARRQQRIELPAGQRAAADAPAPPNAPAAD